MKLVERESPAATPEAPEAAPVLRMVESAPSLFPQTIVPGTATSAPLAHEYAAKPAAPLQAPVVIEPLSLAEEPSATGPSRELRISVPQDSGTASRVEVRVSDRAGEVRVAVHSPDPNVRAAVRSDLQSLVSRLEQAGYGTEVFQPKAGVASDDLMVADTSRTRPDSSSDHNPPSADAAFSDSSGWDSNEGRRERREAPPRPFAPARPRAPGRRFFDEFTR
ncbi:MAG TPA: hypothetical protein VN428_00985 [Bryobacteraceae bacterium]|nr:hypothetical protein [Bryobacteraceae bacterium]